ncbi:MAG: hypothetical protein ABI907_08460 [Ramlibacter sp.]
MKTLLLLAVTALSGCVVYTPYAYNAPYNTPYYSPTAGYVVQDPAFAAIGDGSGFSSFGSFPSYGYGYPAASVNIVTPAPGLRHRHDGPRAGGPRPGWTPRDRNHNGMPDHPHHHHPRTASNP